MKPPTTLFPLPAPAPVPTDGQTWGQLVAAQIMKAKIEHNRRGMPFTVREVGQIIDIADQARPTKRRRVNGRDVIFDAIARACGIDPTQPLTRGMAQTIATAKRDILECSPDVTTGEIERRGKAMKAKFRDTPYGPMGFAKHWSAFPPPRTRKAENGPPGWLARLNAQFPTCVYAKGQAFEITHESPYEWSQLPVEIRRTL